MTGASSPGAAVLQPPLLRGPAAARSSPGTRASCRPSIPPPAGPAASAPRFDLPLPGPAMADFDEIYEEEEDEERALEEQLLKYSPDPVVVRGSGHVTV